jgi:hypothetical protein
MRKPFIGLVMASLLLLSKGSTLVLSKDKFACACQDGGALDHRGGDEVGEAACSTWVPVGK